MPLYLYECGEGHKTEAFFKIADRQPWVTCEKCGKRAPQSITIGGIESDSPAWLNDHVRGCLQDDSLIRQGRIKPIETRSELERFTKERGLVCVG